MNEEFNYFYTNNILYNLNINIFKVQRFIIMVLQKYFQIANGSKIYFEVAYQQCICCANLGCTIQSKQLLEIYPTVVSNKRGFTLSSRQLILHIIISSFKIQLNSAQQFDDKKLAQHKANVHELIYWLYFTTHFYAIKTITSYDCDTLMYIYNLEL